MIKEKTLVGYVKDMIGKYNTGSSYLGSLFKNNVT